MMMVNVFLWGVTFLKVALLLNKLLGICFVFINKTEHTVYAASQINKIAMPMNNANVKQC